MSTQRDALNEYIGELDTTYYRWYHCSHNSDFYGWVALQSLATIAGFATSLLVALQQGNVIDGDWLKAVLIILPFTGSTVSTLLVQTRLKDLAALREQGREYIQYLTSKARADIGAATTEDQVVKLHQDLVANVHKLESTQSRMFHSLLAQSQQAPGGKSRGVGDDNEPHA